jgi:hypothetical protein
MRCLSQHPGNARHAKAYDILSSHHRSYSRERSDVTKLRGTNIGRTAHPDGSPGHLFAHPPNQLLGAAIMCNRSTSRKPWTVSCVVQ